MVQKKVYDEVGQKTKVFVLFIQVLSLHTVSCLACRIDGLRVLKKEKYFGRG